MIDQSPGEMNFRMPVIWLETVRDTKDASKEESDDEEEKENKSFTCPVFKTQKRNGIISSSGKSENHVISIVNYLYNKCIGFT